MPANRKLKLLRALSVISALNLILLPRVAVGQTAPAPDTTTTTTTTTVATPSTATTTSDQEEPSMLSPFVVDASEDKGSYKANSTLAGTRVRTDLNDIASSISVVTAQFLQDTGATNNESLLVYALNTQVGGLQGNFASNVAGSSVFAEPLINPDTNTRVRGLESADNTRDYFLTDIPWDSFDVGRIDLQRGPNSILFGVGSPGGIINASTNDADFTNHDTFENRIGSYGSVRDSLDLNYVLIKNELAIRVSWVNDNEQFQQKPAFNDTTRYYAAVRFDPQIFGPNNHTSIRAKYETGNVTSNNPRQLPPEDQITPWFTDGKPLINNWTIGTDANSAYAASMFGLTGTGNGIDEGRTYWETVLSYFNGVTQPGLANTNTSGGVPSAIHAGELVTRNANGGGSIGDLPGYGPNMVPDYNHYAANTANPAIVPGSGSYYSDKVLTDPSIFNFYDNLLDGPNKREWQNWNAADASISQTFFNDRLAFELVYDKQHHTQGQAGMINAEDYSISVDVNETYSDGTANPNVGRPYVAGSGFDNFNSQTIDRGSLRFTGTYELRFEDFMDKNSLLTQILGRSVFTGLLDEDQRKEFDLQWSQYATTPAWALLIPGKTAASVTNERLFDFVDYIGGNLLGANSASGANLNGMTTVVSPAGANSVDYFNSTWKNPNVSPTAPFNYTSYKTGMPVVGTQGDNPANYVGWQTVPVTWLNANNPADFPNLINSATRLHYADINQGFTYQGYLFDGDFVPTLGYRRDSVVNYSTSGIGNTTTGIVPENFTQDPTSRRQAVGDSKAWGGVYHLPKTLTKWLPWDTTVSIFYDRDENFKADAPRQNLFGDVVGNPDGHTKEYGFTISTLNDKLALKVDWYSTRVDNATFDVTSGNSIAGTGGNGYYMWAAPTWGYFWATQLQDYIEGKTPGNSGNSNYALGDGNTAAKAGPGTPAFDNAPETIGTAGFTGPATGNGFYSAQSIVNAWLALPVPDGFFNYYGIHPITITPSLARTSGQLASAFGSGFTAGVTDAQGFSPGNEQPGAISAVSTVTTLSKGTEWELSAQPIRNWNVTLNFATTNATHIQIDPATVALMANLETFFNGPGGQIRMWSNGGGNGNLIGFNWTNNVYNPYLTEVASEGQRAPDLPSWTANAVTTYNFDRGPLKGWLIGGAFREESSRILGYQYNATLNGGLGGLDVSKPWNGPEESHVDLWLGYQRRMFANKINWRTQLNVTNVGQSTTLKAAQYEPDGSLALARIENGMEWTLTNTFDF
jgi:hypothetical protein